MQKCTHMPEAKAQSYLGTCTTKQTRVAPSLQQSIQRHIFLHDTFVVAIFHRLQNQVSQNLIPIYPKSPKTAVSNLTSHMYKFHPATRHGVLVQLP